MRVFVILGVLLFAANVWAQESAADLKPPLSEQGEKFKSTVKENYQYTDIRYMDPDQKLDGIDITKLPKEKQTSQPSKVDYAARNKMMKTISLVILAGIAIAILVYLYNERTGGNLFRWFKKKDRFAGSNGESLADSLADAAENSQLSHTHLQSITDPETGLHELLVQALIRAAQQNNIPLRRSLTSREILRRVPTSWPHRDILYALVNRTELVLFGGRSMAMEDYQTALAMAQPLIAGDRKR